MRVAARIKQLHIYPDFASSLLHAAFEHGGHAEFAGHCLQVFRLAFVFGGGSPRDNFQVADTSEFGQDFILSAVGEIGVIRVVSSGFQTVAQRSISLARSASRVRARPAAFPRRVFGKRDRRATGPRADRA